MTKKKTVKIDKQLDKSIHNMLDFLNEEIWKEEKKKK